MPVEVTCEVCGKRETVTKSRAAAYRCCSYKCIGEVRRKLVGELHPRWTGGEREKTCQHCGAAFSIREGQPITTFKAQKFCSKACADAGGHRWKGTEHPNYRSNARRRNRGDGHAKWARAVISRDHATCRHCGAQGVELHAHHVKSYRDHPELRLDVSNGITLCYRCHWLVHAASNENGVNSVDTLSEGNTEPSSGRKVLEGVTTRGRAYRRVCTECAWCGTFISKQLSDAKGKKHLFCSKRCAGKFNAANRSPKAVTSPTNAPRESEDIV